MSVCFNAASKDMVILTANTAPVRVGFGSVRRVRAVRWVLVRGFASVLGLLLLAQPAFALCVLLPLKTHLKNKQITSIFHGTVREIQGHKVTFDVDRVWKGPRDRTMSVINPDQFLT